MARYPFGGSIADWTFTTASAGTTDNAGTVDNLAQVIGGVEVTFWNAETFGTQHVDLLNAAGAAVTSVTSSDGSDGRAVGTIPPLQGPDGITEMWAQAGENGPRSLVKAVLGPTVLANEAAAAKAQADLAAHIAQDNPHGTALADLSDAAVGTPESRVNTYVLTWDSASQRFVLSAPAAVSGAVLLNPRDASGTYVGNVASAPDPTQGQNGNPWLLMQLPYSGTDDNPDSIQIFSTSSGGQLIKCGWFNGNGEFRAAPSTTNRVALRVFEAYENRGGPSTGMFFQLSTNPTNAAAREALLGAYGTGHTSKPGWVEATRILSALLGVRAGGNYNGLTAVTFRGQRASAGAPTSGSWVAGDVIIDSAGALYLCTAGGTPGTWVTSSGGGGGGSNEAGPTAFVPLTANTGMALGAKPAASRLDRGGDNGRLRGTLEATASVASGAVLATIADASHRPLDTVTLIARSSNGGAKLTINTDGTITYGQSFTAGQELWLDSVTWDMTS